jgi:2,5-furandicarboxylate decarboxylase 1
MIRIPVHRAPPAVLDLRSFLAGHAEAIFRPTAILSVVHQITALQVALEETGRQPIVMVDRPLLSDGSRSDLDVVCNLTASRVLTAHALALTDHRQAARELSVRSATPIEPLVVDRAPVHEVIQRGEAVDLTRLPASVQHEMDPGPYLTAAHATTVDPDSGIDNTAIQRCWIKGPRMMSYFPYPASHNARNLRKFWAKGEACPIAFWIGHHPAVQIGAQAKLGYPESHWAATGGTIGQPLRLVPSLTHGARIMVPADAEIVIEGFVPANRLEADGPFGEYTGYLGPQTAAPVCEVTAITRRRQALYHDYASGLADMLVPDNMAMEAKLFAMAKAIAPSLVNVHVPVSGRRFHAYLQLADPAPGEARDALMAALAYRRCKTAIALDQDIDIFDDGAVMWALATRVQWSRDGVIVDGLSGSLLDPSLPAGARTTSKMAIDATLPPARPSEPRLVAPRARVPDDALALARQLVDRP